MFTMLHKYITKLCYIILVHGYLKEIILNEDKKRSNQNYLKQKMWTTGCVNQVRTYFPWITFYSLNFYQVHTFVVSQWCIFHSSSIGFFFAIPQFIALGAESINRKSWWVIKNILNNFDQVLVMFELSFITIHNRCNYDHNYYLRFVDLNTRFLI